MTMRKGRKRKAGLRTPSGHLSRSKAAMIAKAEQGLTQNQPHRRTVPKDMRSDQRAESVLGHLFLTGKITEPECWAGESYRTAMWDFHRVMASPTMPVSSLTSMIAPGMETPAEADHLSSETPLTPEERQERAFDRFDDAMAVVGACERHGGILRGGLFALLDDIVMQDRTPDTMALSKLRLVLQSLAAKWGFAEDKGKLRIRGKIMDRPSWGHDEKIIEFVR